MIVGIFVAGIVSSSGFSYFSSGNQLLSAKIFDASEILSGVTEISSEFLEDSPWNALVFAIVTSLSGL